MDKYRIQARVVKNVAASKTVLIELPVGPRYHYVAIQHGYASGTNTIAAAATNVNEVRVKKDGRVQRTVSGTQLRDMNILNGTAYDCTGLPNTAPGVAFPIFFAEPWRQDEVDQDALAWPTSGWQTFQIEVDLAAAGTPTLVAWAVVDNFVPKTQPGLVKWIRQSIAASGTKFDELIEKRDWLQQISLYPDSGGSNAPTQVDFRRNGEILHELTSSANTALITNYGMTPAASGRTANIYDLVIDHDGLLGSAVSLDGARDATISVYAGGAMSGTTIALIQRLGPPE
jgi:hypothetical protein